MKIRTSASLTLSALLGLFGLAPFDMALSQSATNTNPAPRTQNPLWQLRGPLLPGAHITNSAMLEIVRAGKAPRTPPARTLVETGPHSRTWSIAEGTQASSSYQKTRTAASGGAPTAASQGAQGSHRIVEIASGMHYWDGTNWARSEPSFAISQAGDAYVADKVHLGVRLNGELNVAGAVTIQTSDGGSPVHATPVGIGLTDRSSGRFQLIAVVTNSEAQLVGTNADTVLYRDAFAGAGVCANLVCKITRGSYEQDVVITGRLDPSWWGFPTNDLTLIQVITEIYNPPDFERVRRPVYIEQNPTLRAKLAIPDLMDDQLNLEGMGFVGGRAFSGGASEDGKTVVVCKELKTVDTRTFLVESVNYAAACQHLNSLPDCREGVKP